MLLHWNFMLSQKGKVQLCRWWRYCWSVCLVVCILHISYFSRFSFIDTSPAMIWTETINYYTSQLKYMSLYGLHLFKSKRGGGSGAVPNYTQRGKGLSHYVPYLWGVKSQNDVSKAQFWGVRLPKAPTARPNRLVTNAAKAAKPWRVWNGPVGWFCCECNIRGAFREVLGHIGRPAARKLADCCHYQGTSDGLLRHCTAIFGMEAVLWIVGWLNGSGRLVCTGWGGKTRTMQQVNRPLFQR